jgi:hypothetical protein
MLALGLKVVMAAIYHKFRPPAGEGYSLAEKNFHLPSGVMPTR